MEQSSKITKILSFLGIIILFSAIGFYAGQSIEKAVSKNVKDELVKEIFSSDVNLVFSSFSGVIKDISSDKKSLSLEVTNPFPGVNFPKSHRIKTVLIDADTKIILTEQKDMDEFNKELADFIVKQKNVVPPKIGSVPEMPISSPMPFTRKDITAYDLKVGDQISFNFDFDENFSILDSQFTANEINLNRNQQVNTAVPL